MISIITQALPIDIYWITLMIIFGFVIGLFSLVYTFLFNRLIYIFHRISEAWERILLSAIVLAIFIVLSGVFFPEIPIAATGFEFLELLSGNEQFQKLEIVFILLLIKATIILFVIGGGNAVGIFSPTLVLGALVGTLFAIITGQTEQIGIFFILGMSGMLSSSAKTPIASMILILEITGLPVHLIFYMAIVTSVAYVVSGERGLYKDQLNDRREAIQQRLKSKDYLAQIPVSSIMTTKVQSLSPEMTIAEVDLLFDTTRKHTMVVINSEREVVGILSDEDIPTEIDQTQPVANIMIKKVYTVTPDMSLQDALNVVLTHEIERFPVINEDNKLIGFITLRDMLRAYKRQEKVERRLKSHHHVDSSRDP